MTDPQPPGRGHVALAHTRTVMSHTAFGQGSGLFVLWRSCSPRRQHWRCSLSINPHRNPKVYPCPCPRPRPQSMLCCFNHSRTRRECISFPSSVFRQVESKATLVRADHIRALPHGLVPNEPISRSIAHFIKINGVRLE